MSNAQSNGAERASADSLAVNRAPFTLRAAAQATGGEILRGPQDLELCGVSTDTRAIQPGALFVALRGERFDGHKFLAQAAAAGARAAVVDEKEKLDAPDDLALLRVPDTLFALGNLARAHRRRFAIPVIGVTGSYGKTTTRALIAAALSPLGRMLSSSANFNNEIGVPLTLLQLDESHRAAVIEMAMRGAGQIEYLAQVAEPTIGVVTNIGPQHIELLGSEENIARAKAELISSLPVDGLAVLPADDKYLDLLRWGARCRVVTFGEDENADYRAYNIAIADDGNSTFSLGTQHSSLRTLKLPLPGAHNTLNAAAALVVAGEIGVALEDAAHALEQAEVPGARMRIVRSGGLTIIDDCYNAGPDSMRAALQTLRDLPAPNRGARRVAVLGAMKELGAWTEEEHRKIGALAATCADVIVGVGEETRALLEAAADVENHWRADAVEAAHFVSTTVRADDLVLVKGSRSVGLEKVVSALAGK